MTNRMSIMRCVLPLLLIPCLLVTQFVALVNCTHFGEQSFTRHLHTSSLFGQPNQVAQVHGGCGCQHHQRAHLPNKIAPLCTETPLPHHNEDAVYVVASDVVVQRLSVEIDSWVLSSDSCTAEFTWVNVPAKNTLLRQQLPPPRLPAACPLYVRHLTLLI